MNLPLIFLTLLAPFVVSLEVDGDTVIIYNASDFIELSNNVNKGTETYAGSTVLLGADIDFTNYSDQFEPIGIDQDIYFRGKFDGQGHTVSNLHIVSDRQHVSLFGVINASGFKNVVVDASCSFTNTYNFTVYYSYTSGVVAYAYLVDKKAKPVIENLVNMAAVTFAGGFESKPSEETVITISVGGVVGFTLPEVTNILIRNCANYGVITISGHCEYASIGGILGAFFRQSLTSKTSCSVKNCVNFGNIIHTGDTEKMLGFGGLVGTALYGIFENNMIFSIFISNKETEGSGKVTGGANSQLTVNNCYWISEEDVARTWGYEYGAPPTPGENNKLVEANEEILNALNEWVENNANEDGSNDYSKWVMLYLDGGFINVANTSTPFTLNGLPIIAPNKPGYLFDHWCLDSDCADGPATEEEVLNESTTELYAQWRVNNFTITFDLGNGTLVTAIFTYNTTIIYPDMTGIKGFYGWNITLDLMPPYDLIIGPAPKPPKKSKAGAIAGGVVGGIAGVAIIVLVVLFLLLSKTRNDSGMDSILLRRFGRGDRSGRSDRNDRAARRYGRTDRPGMDGRGGRGAGMYGRGVMQRGVMMRGGGGVDGGAEGDGEGGEGGDGAARGLVPITLETLYPEYYRVPAMIDALEEAGIGRDLAKVVVDVCMDNAKDVAEDGFLAEGLTEEDAAAIAMYTFDFGPEKETLNPFHIINARLMGEGNPEEMRGIFYLFMSALRKLPRVEDRLLYRSIKEPIKRGTYKNGSIIRWPGPASTSPDMKATKNLLEEEEGNEQSSKGTLIIIENAWGYNIQPYSLSPEDEEILLEPDRRLRVESVIEADITIVKLSMLDTPLVLPQLFGEGKKI